MIDRQKRGRLMATARQSLQTAFEAVKEVSDMLDKITNTVDGDKWCPCPDGYDD